MISLPTARACIAHLAALRGARVIEPDDIVSVIAHAAIDGALSLVPAPLQVVAGPLSRSLDGVSLTLPTPLGPVVLLSAAALVDGPAYFATGLHELVHVSQIDRVGGVQSVVDYLGSGELRAHREGEGSGVGLWARYLVTGTPPKADDASVLRSDAYHLDPPDAAFARAVVEAVLASIEVGALPPFRVVREALAWLQAHAPEAIAVESYRAVPQ